MTDSVKDWRVRHACFVINNYDCTEITKAKAWGQVRYACMGYEKCPTTGTPHLQCYIEYKQQVWVSTMKNMISQKCAHIEPRYANSSPEQAAKYCKKDDDYHEWGEISHQGKTSELTAVVEMITDGLPLRQVARTYPEQYVRFHKGLRALKCELIEPRNELPEVIVYYGETGVGKSKLAREITEDSYVWGPENDKWFDGYQGEKHVIFEEFRGQLPFGQMLRLLDRYDCKVQYKGGMCEFAGNKIVITSPVHPKYWYEGLAHNDGKLNQLMRRITKVEEMFLED